MEENHLLHDDLFQRILPFLKENINIVKVERAIGFATDFHQGQTRKQSKEPYIYHPVEAATILLQLDQRSAESEIIATILHDTVEDTDATLEMIAEEFGEDASVIVDGLTDKFVPDGGKTNRATRKALEAKRIGKAGSLCKNARLLTCCLTVPLWSA